MSGPALETAVVAPEPPVTGGTLDAPAFAARRRPPTWRALALLTLGIAAAAVGITLVVAGEGYKAHHDQTWPVGQQRGEWVAQFDGYGRIAVERGGAGPAIAIAPAPSRQPGETHAGLVTSARSFGDVDFEVPVLTAAQLRQPRPNPWEVAWVLWDYTDNTHFMYAALKPNGWEIGQASPAGQGNQRILATGSSPRFAVGEWHRLRVRKSGTRVSVWAHGKHLTTFDDPGAYAGGRIGLYTEDADTRFGPVRVNRPAALLAPPAS